MTKKNAVTEYRDGILFFCETVFLKTLNYLNSHKLKIVGIFY